jgi:hypothetical protein
MATLQTQENFSSGELPCFPATNQKLKLADEGRTLKRAQATTSHPQCGPPTQADLAQLLHLQNLGEVGAVALAMAGVLPRGPGLLQCSLD